ncbi:5-formyltetrahydrofolate cyclo-ligase [Corynebacterium belfantii]|uniref:5-formyltetrahydrofolate cyclo-ligase n=1 Tax=Corynebacterium belfantii TaxID=2014537 RepID=UPI0018D31B98|nr:5-formyltetrahydrofolate cyclo-ligase [Corynebacterium belfantii]MBG9330065.1 5-formyltetrahydrofolate cyclo-ligase [Corynebacterium belfantii]
MSDVLTLTAAKKNARNRIRTARLSRSAADLHADNTAILTHLTALIRTINATRAVAYMPEVTEPGGVDFANNLTKVLTELWIPKSLPNHQLVWGNYSGADSVELGTFGILEPTTPSRSSDILHDVDLIIVPALGITPSGRRLGQGAGYYDRALAGVDTPTAAILFDAEVNTTIPFEPHDATCDWIISPEGTKQAT